MDYHAKAKKEGSKQNKVFADELETLAIRMQKKIDNGKNRYQELAKLWDKVTDGDFTKRNQAVSDLYEALHV